MTSKLTSDSLENGGVRTHALGAETTKVKEEKSDGRRMRVAQLAVLEWTHWLWLGEWNIKVI